MFRLLIACFALLLPLQFAWAGAAAYCEHETSADKAAHFGHHAHVHTDLNEGEGKPPTGKPFTADADCGACHASVAGLIVDAGTSLHGALRSAHAAPPGLARKASASARAPDRPQWLRLA